MGVRARLDRRVTRGFPRGSPFLKAAVCQSGRGRLFFFSPNHAEVPSARDLQSARLTIVPSRLRRLSTWPTKVRFPPSCAITAPAWSRYASDLPHVLGVPSALFWLQRSTSNVGSTTPRSQRARARSEASDARASFPDHLPSPLARSPSRFHPSRAIASAPPRDHPERTSDARSAVVPIDPRRDARVSRVTARPRSFELTDSPPTVAPSLPSRLVSPATTPPAPSSPPSWVAPATRA